MSESLMAWYERELNLLYEGSKSFAKEYPQLAKHLGLTRHQVDDPHVARVCEAIALLNARQSKQLSEESTQLSSSLLSVIFPLSLQSLPSVSMVRIPPSEDQPQVSTVASGTPLRIYINEERYCQFRTTRDLQLLPFDIHKHALEVRPFNLEHIKYPNSANALLRLDFHMLDESRIFSELIDCNELSIYFDGLISHQAQVYDDLCRKRCRMILVNEDGNTFELDNDQFQPVGFSEHECMMTKKACQFIDYQMCLELFSWPELFTGFKLVGIGKALKNFFSRKISLLLFIEGATDGLLTAVQGVKFQLGCAPIINLFEHIAEPLIIDHRKISYPVIADTKAKHTMEIQEVTSLIDVTGDEPSIVPPLFGLKHNEKNKGIFWHYQVPDESDADHFGRISLVYPNLNPDDNQSMVVSTHLICTNGISVLDIPENPKIECLESIALASEPVLIMRPTPRIKRSMDVKKRLDLLVHLKGAFIGLLNAPNQADYLRTLMSLYCIRNNGINMAWLNSIVSLQHRSLVAPIRINGRQCFVQGMELIIELDATQIKEVSIMMFVNLLNFMASGYAGYQGFVELVIFLKGESREYIRCLRHHGFQKNP
ncbi:MAG: type VI secretion system baseplate subunit TssF [Endozoicomonas sp. (ex Botrylloides leachii)]|nr:type VI secretion system baseplate subunit TssF [Endozoicomonas sp. (ex Botrylloides leachii)]